MVALFPFSLLYLAPGDSTTLIAEDNATAEFVAKVQANLAPTAAALSLHLKQLMDQIRLPSDALDRLPHEFSGGQHQPIGIGGALAVEPELIICDEAVSVPLHRTSALSGAGPVGCMPSGQGRAMIDPVVTSHNPTS